MIGRRILCVGTVLLAAVGMPSRAASRADAPGHTYGDGGTSAFYRWSGALPAGPGAMLRTEPLEPDKLLSGAAEGFRILYSSTSGFGPPDRISVSGEIFVPRGEPPPGGWPVIAWAHGTTGTADICAPSWTRASPRDADYLNGWLARGYAVVATDYEGLGTPGPHPYMAIRSAAYSVLDAVRAARAQFPALGAATVIVGQSQGAHAAIGAGLYSPAYAPGLDIRGVVATGVPGEAGFAFMDNDPTTIVAAQPIDPGTPRLTLRGIILDRFDGWALVYLEYFASYGRTDKSFRAADYLTPLGLRMLAEMNQSCGTSAAVKNYVMQKPPASAIFRKDPAPYEARFVADRRYPLPAFTMPVFIGIGLQDEMTAPELSYNVARSACAAGSRVMLRFYPGLGHSEAVLPSQTDSSGFVKTVFGGGVPENDCVRLEWKGRAS